MPTCVCVCVCVYLSMYMEILLQVLCFDYVSQNSRNYFDNVVTFKA